MPKKPKSGLLLSYRDIEFVDAKRITQRINRTWVSILKEALVLRGFPEEERDALFWARCTCWRRSVWTFEDELTFCNECKFISYVKYMEIIEQLKSLIEEVESRESNVKL